jgi:hypothetical protein
MMDGYCLGKLPKEVMREMLMFGEIIEEGKEKSSMMHVSFGRPGHVKPISIGKQYA